MNEDRLRRWFEGLEEQITDDHELEMALSSDYPEPELWIGWATSCANLLDLLYGPNSRFYKRFHETLENCLSTPSQRLVLSLHALFRSAKAEYLGGYVDFNLKITGDVLGNFVALAKEALGAGHKDVASVLASAALEDALKRYAIANCIDAEDAEMSQVISALKSKGLIQRGTSKALQPLPSIRNFALHANWDKLTEVEIGGLIGFVEAFLIKHFQAEDR
jgi:hypothetical protein